MSAGEPAAKLGYSFFKAEPSILFRAVVPAACAAVSSCVCAYLAWWGDSPQPSSPEPPRSPARCASVSSSVAPRGASVGSQDAKSWTFFFQIPSPSVFSNSLPQSIRFQNWSYATIKVVLNTASAEAIFEAARGQTRASFFEKASFSRARARARAARGRRGRRADLRRHGLFRVERLWSAWEI